MIKVKLKRITALLLSGIMIASSLATPAYAIYSYYSMDALTDADRAIKDWTWSADAEQEALDPLVGLTPTGLSQQQTAIMGGYTTKFWFQDEGAKTVTINHNGKDIEIDFSKFNHRYYSCADSHNTGWFAPIGSQMVFKQMYFPTTNLGDYPEFIKNAPVDMEEKKFILLMISMLSAAYETPSASDLKDSDCSSMYYYLLWLSIWANDIYADSGVFHGVSPEDDWDYVRDMVRVGYPERLNPDAWGSTAIYDAFRDGGPAQKYFFNCWRAAKFLSTFDYSDIGTSLPLSEPIMGEDGMYHMTFDYSSLDEYSKEVYRRLVADNLAAGWEYDNNGSYIDFKSADGNSDGNAIAVLRFQENSEEDHFYNCGFGIGGLAGFRGCSKGKGTRPTWGNTQTYFSAVSEPLEILVGGILTGTGGEGDWKVSVDRYEHTETWETHYNVQLRKYDSETGQPLAGSKWDILEAFDASQLDSTDLESADNWANAKGSQFLRWDGWDYGDGNPDGDIANDPCTWDINVTNSDGLLMLGDNEENATNKVAHTDVKSYTYTKGYCGGHPDPDIEESGDPEVDAEIEAAAQEAWEAEVNKCEELAAKGGFFHSIDPGTAQEDLEADRNEYYKQFISLRYDYSAVELNPRPGYTIHGVHKDDIPIEIKTVTSSEYKDSNNKPTSLKESTQMRMKMLQPILPQADLGGERTNYVADGNTNVATPAHASASTADYEVEEMEDIEQEDSEEATPSNATASNAKKKTRLLSQLKDLFEAPKKLIEKNTVSLYASADDDNNDSLDGNFKPSEVPTISPIDGSIVDHTFVVYDHRTEGEIHINKRDLYLKDGENDNYDAYGDAVGDGTLEGAVYGLFALQNINHPDGHTGTVYQKDDLVAVATTDRNGDASFMAYTEAPGMTWNYNSGMIEKRPGDIHGPDNLYRDQAAADAVNDIENYIGHDSDGRVIQLIDSVAGDGSAYQKNSSNQAGIDGVMGTYATYPISNNEEENGNCWIGRPLIVEEGGTTYYIKELARSEGYELSVNGKTNLITNGQNNFEGEFKAADVTIGPITLDLTNNGNYFDITAQNVEHDITLQGNDFPAGAAFSISTIEKVPEKITVPVYSIIKKPVIATTGAFVFRDGQKVLADIGDTVSFASGQTYTVNAVSAKTDKTIGAKPLNYHTLGTPTVTDLHSGGSAAAFQSLYNTELENLGYKEPGTDAPWIRVKLSGTTDTERITAITTAILNYDLQYFNALRITDMEQSGGSLYAIMQYEWQLYGDSRDNSVYVPDKDRLYMKKDSGNGYFVYARYDDVVSNPAVISFQMKNGFLERATLKDQEVSGLNVTYPEQLPEMYTLVTAQTPSYWVYAAGEQQIDDAGELKYTEETKVEYVQQDGFKEVERTIKLTSLYDAAQKTYTITLPMEAFDNAEKIKLKVSDDGSGAYSVKQAYVKQSYFTYLPLSQNDDSYVMYITLMRPAADQPWQDGNTRVDKVGVLQRPIQQKVKIVKDISINEAGKYEDNTFAGSGHEDGFTQNGGGTEDNAAYRPNFRFKIYLKSNLEQLYRDEEGKIDWQDRNGNIIDIAAYRAAYPEKVQKIYSKVPHLTDPLVRRSNDAAIANTELYSYTSGKINDNQNNGYTSVLETTIQTVQEPGGDERTIARYNYSKFFHAINVANQDKWDKVNDRSTSFKPFAIIKSLLFGKDGAENAYPAGHNNAEIRNEINTSDAAKENATRSDHVRQFAISWYLDDEVKKLVKENNAGETEGATGSESYQDEIYDIALFQAIMKAENYLKPFFTYDLDEIYSIEWDGEADGGKDGDKTTLSADQEDAAAEYCYGVSEYLPYGSYVTVEQQPAEKDLDDFYNKHYKIDEPKEIELPAVYEGGKAGVDTTPEQLSNHYKYKESEPVAKLTAKYYIRFNEEWPEVGNENNYIIKAHGYYGDYEIYKYGLDLDKLDGTAAGDPTGAAHFQITQSPMDPTKDYYNTIVDPEEQGGNPDSYYFADDGNTGKTTANGEQYEADAVERIYHYGSISEDKQVYNNVSYPTEKGEEYQDNITVMEGMQIAYDGKYAPMLVPWTVTEPVDELVDMAQKPDGSSSYKGYAYRKYRNTYYTSKLRIEKLDAETGENILHDGAFFALYAAEREDGQDTDGLIKFYEQETLIKGSKEFLEAMGATQITPAARALPDIGGLWTGYVPAGTPICSEAEQIILTDQSGRRTGLFEAFTTTRDGIQAKEEDLTQTAIQDQNTGYLVTPQPLGAGTYVLCEVRPPAGYVRTKPVAIEIYSDKISYYLDGDRDNRVAASIYEDETGEGPQGIEDTARIYVGNTPIRLEISKIKVKDQTVTYKTNTRVEGTEAELGAKYGKENLEYAYKNGMYLGYAWYKGTLEYLESRKASGEPVEPVYIDGIFAGYGVVTRPLDTADDINRYVAGARVTLYDAIEVTANGDSGDYGYDGVEVVRDRNNNVQSIKVLEGYAGNRVEFVNLDDVAGSVSGSTGPGTWTYQTIDRKDSDILYYSLGDLTVTETGADGRIWGFDRYGNRIQVKNQESIYVLKNGRPIFELTGGDLEQVQYSSVDKRFTLPAGTSLYHVSDGNRDAMVHPTTGMAYTTEDAISADGKPYKKIMVWPVNVSKRNGEIIAQEKIKTYRIASIDADTENEYTIGTYDGAGLKKSVNPTIDEHGLPEYYQRSDQEYTKGEPVYDIDNDYVRYRYYDLLPAFNRNAYRINNEQELREIGEEEDPADDQKLYHRQGEAWIMENTWITGEKYPNDPFGAEMTVGQVDMLKRVIPGTYILEELEAPAGYVQSLPVGVTVTETTGIQAAELQDGKIKVEIVKTDAADQYRIDVISDYQTGLSTAEPKGSYSYGQIAGSHLTMYKARRVYTTDTAAHPKGYYLEKVEARPAEWVVENTVDNTPVTVVADWITDGTPKYFEGIPAGDYILEEKEAPSGFVRCSMEVEVKASGEVQNYNLKNDHVKLEIYKYYRDSNGNMSQLLNDHAAGLALYRAKTDGNGNILIVDGQPQYDEAQLIEEWMTDDLSDYTENYETSTNFVDRIKNFLGFRGNTSFIASFEEKYQEEGDQLVYITWQTKRGERSANRISDKQTGMTDSTVQLWQTDEGKTIRITIYRNVTNGATDDSGQLPLNFEYQFNYRELADMMKSYDTLEGMHRIDYLPFTDVRDGVGVGNYVLVETQVPEGYEAAKPKAITITETGAVQRFSLENIDKHIQVLKVITDGVEDYAAEGVKLALYRADENGNFAETDTLLVESWISGSDGRYTEQDKFAGYIPTGFEVGDLRPHKISEIPYGTYYIAELEIPPYMAMADPVKIEVGAETVPVYRIVNKPTQGRLEIKKTAEDTGEMLANARFKVTNKDTGEMWYITTGQSGQAELPGLPVGVVQTDGTISPYTYKIEEISPPDLYQVDGGVKYFQFDGNVNSQVVTYTHEVVDRPTEIRFKKTNFNTGMAVKGARIAIYNAIVVDGQYVKDGEAIEEIISGADGFTVKRKLSANHVYIMEELEAPAGMHLADPVIFTVNTFGTGLRNIANDFSVIKFADDHGTIESMTVTGRVANKVFTVFKDLDDGSELPAFIGSTDLKLTEADGILEGHLYEITEYTRYSDGHVEKSSKETKRIYFDEEGGYTQPLRTYLETMQELTDQEGSTLAAWIVNPNQLEYTIENPVVEEAIVAQVTGNVGKGYAAVKKGDVMKYTITYENPSNQPADITIRAILQESLDYMRSSGSSREQNGIVTWQIQDVEPHKIGTVELVAAVVETKGWAKTAFQVGDIPEFELGNPIAPAGSLTIRNHLSGTGKEIEDIFKYKIKFFDSSGNILRGYQNFTGSRNGRIKGEGMITLAGEEAVTFESLPYGTRYEINQEAAYDYELITETYTGEITPDLQSAVFENHRNDETKRNILTAGANYRLMETTKYSDGEEWQSGIYRFSLNESGSVDNVDMEDRPVQVYFSKRDITTDEEISGGHYSLLDAATGGLIYEFDKTADKEVLIPADILMPGKEYILREDLAPTGYAYEDEIKFAVNEDGIPEVVIMQDTKTDVSLLKIDAVTKEPLSGGRYQVSDSNGAVVYQFTASGKPEQLNGILRAGESYTLEEVEPPSGYAYSKKIPFTVPQSPKTIEIVMEDKPTNLLVEKLTEAMVASPSEAEHQLSGFKLQILNADKSPAIAARTTEDFKAGEELIFTTGNQFKQLIGQLIAGQSYWLHEISPRDGYAYAEDVMFTVSLDGREDIVLMVDKPTQVIVSKKAITGDNELPGNYMSIRNMAGAVIEEWISAEDPHIITAKLVAGETYLLCEERPLEGYAYASAVEFTVSLDGTIDRIEMKNEMTKVRIIKMNSSGNHLKGAVLQVLDAQKNIVIPDFESTGDAMEIAGQLTAGRQYYLHEVQAPAGYLLSADVPFTVPKGAEVVEVRMSDPKKPTSEPDVNQMYLRKVDALTGKGIEGVEFSVYQPNGNLYSVYVTGYDGYAKFDVPRDGTYTYRETQAAPGYIVTDEVYSFTIRDGRITNQSTVSVVNVPVPDIKIEKIDGVSGERLSGAKVRIWNDTWTTVELTEEDGSFTINPPAAGRYYIQEIEAPAGYKLNDTVYEFVIQLDGSITGTTVIYNYPEDGKPEKKIGRVTAVYRSGLSGRGYTEFGIPGIHVPGVKTGDDTPIRRYLLLCAASLAGIVGIAFIRRRKKK